MNDLIRPSDASNSDSRMEFLLKRLHMDESEPFHLLYKLLLKTITDNQQAYREAIDELKKLIQLDRDERKSVMEQLNEIKGMLNQRSLGAIFGRRKRGKLAWLYEKLPWLEGKPLVLVAMVTAACVIFYVGFGSLFTAESADASLARYVRSYCSAPEHVTAERGNSFCKVPVNPPGATNNGR